MINKRLFGYTANREAVYAYTVANTQGISFTLLNYGLIIQELLIPDLHGVSEDVVLGFDSVASYENDCSYIGCIVGRYANRIANGSFTLEGVPVQLSQNEGANQLHGGAQGFHKRLWTIEVIQTEEAPPFLRCSYLSQDGEEGYPGNLQLCVTFRLTDQQTLEIEYKATTDQTTVVNLARHDYFNLKDGGATMIWDHELQIRGRQVTTTNAAGIPDGNLQEVAGTSFDFEIYRPLGQNRQKGIPVLLKGYDSNYVLEPNPELTPNSSSGLRYIAGLFDSDTQRSLRVYSTQPGLQLYTAGNLTDVQGKNAQTYKQYHGVCLEAQHYPDAPNHPHFESTLLTPEATYHQHLQYHFGLGKG